MKVLVVSDEENDFIWEHFDKERFSDIELIISCGDLKREYLEFLVSMIPCPLIYVPGNHDKTYIDHPPEGCVNIHSKLYRYKGITFLGLGGCKSPKKDIYEYRENDMKKILNNMSFKLFRNKGFDVLITHAPAFGVGDGKDIFHQGFECFHDLIRKYNPKYHFYGHQHLRYGPLKESVNITGNTKHINACGYHILDI